MPIIATRASAAYGAGFSRVVTPPIELFGSYDALTSVTLSSTSSSITFSGIPSDYKHLQLRIIARDNQAGTGFNNAIMRVNGDSGSNYSSHSISGNGTSVTASGSASISSWNPALYIAADGNTAGLFGVTIIDILDYSSTSKYKTMRSFTGGDANGSGIVLTTSTLWRNTSVISSVAFTGTTYQANSQFALYGVK